MKIWTTGLLLACLFLLGCEQPLPETPSEPLATAVTAPQTPAEQETPDEPTEDKPAGARIGFAC